jgi:alanyl-tRNA synthetase
MATKSVHVGLEHSTIDLAGPFLTASDAFEAEAVVNDAIAEGYNIITHECPPEDLASFPLRRRPPETDGVIRVVEIDGVDFTPCCGTHVRNTADLRLILFLGTERYKGMTRLFFVGGGRAVAAARASFRASREAGSILGVAYGDVGAEAGRVCARLKATQASMRSLVRARASTEAAAAISAAPSAGPIVLCFQDRDADAVIEACKAMAERGRMAIAASVPDLTVCVASHDADARLNERLLPILTQLGGKGGGSESFFRAFFAKKPDFDEFLSIARKKLQN